MDSVTTTTNEADESVTRVVESEGPFETTDLTETEANNEEIKPTVQDGLFTSEIFKIELQNLPKVVGFAQIKKFIGSKDLKPIKVKQPAGNCSFAFVTFGSEEERQKALKVLNGAVFKGRTLSAFVSL